MTRNFEKCLVVILKNEGGFVNHPKDPGGITNLGVTKRTYEHFLNRSVSEQEMRDLTAHNVAPVYKKMYWDKVKGDQLPEGLDLCVFDFAVNSGPSRAIKTLQLIVNSKPDGIIGTNTLNALDTVIKETSLIHVCTLYSNERNNFYKSLSNYSVFGKGWSNRVDHTLEIALLRIK